MIEHLSGRLIDKNPTKAIISAGGVGYGALISLATYEKLPEVGNEASLYMHLAVREDSLTLFGFATVGERELFLLLTSVTGVGPKLGIGILSGSSIDVLKENISRGNSAALTRLPGIGKKTAERLVLEIRDKIGAIDSSITGYDQQKVDARDEALAAMLTLGYNRAAAERAIRSALSDGEDADANVETLIKGALKHINAG